MAHVLAQPVASRAPAGGDDARLEDPEPDGDPTRAEQSAVAPHASLPLVALVLGIAGVALGVTVIWFFAAIPLVADRESKEPLDSSLRTHAKLKAEAMRRGLLIYPMGGTVDGVRGDHVLLAPPFICTEAEIDEIAGRLTEAIDAVIPAP